MSNLFISMSPDIFPSPTTFDPDRWGTPNSPERRRLERHLHPFGKGTKCPYLGFFITHAK